MLRARFLRLFSRAPVMVRAPAFCEKVSEGLLKLTLPPLAMLKVPVLVMLPPKVVGMLRLTVPELARTPVMVSKSSGKMR